MTSIELGDAYNIRLAIEALSDIYRSRCPFGFRYDIKFLFIDAFHLYGLLSPTSLFRKI